MVAKLTFKQDIIYWTWWAISFMGCAVSVWFIIGNTGTRSLMMSSFMMFLSLSMCMVTFLGRPNSYRGAVDTATFKKKSITSEHLLSQDALKVKTILGIFGSTVLVIGVFAPIMSFPIVGSINSFANGKGDGVLLLVLALLSILLVLNKKFKMLWLTGGASLGIIVYYVTMFQLKISEIKGEMDTDLADNPFRGLADVALASFQLQWGVAVLAIGSIMIIASAAVKSKFLFSLSS